MSLIDVILGRRQVKAPAKDRLFAITTAYVSLEAAHGIVPAGRAAIVFQPLASSEFEATVRDMEAVVRETGSESGTAVATQDDSYGYRWMVLSNSSDSASVEDLAVGINAVSGSIESAGHGERLLCAVFAFKDSKDQRIYLIYNYKRGHWYPFVPKGSAASASSTGAARSFSYSGAGGSGGGRQGGSGAGFSAGERSTERELQLKAQLAEDLPIEPELERWFPLWGIPI